MHIVVTGGAGFIGSHLCAALLAADHTVTILDNYVTGNPRNIAGLRDNPRLQVVEHDVSRPLPPGLPAPDQIYHLASPASPADFSRIPLQIMQTNSFGTYHLLEWAARTGARLLFTSTSEAYGDPLVHPQVETYWGNVNSVGPRACYDESKRFGEALIMTYVREQDLDGRLVRIFNTYGPHMNPQDGRVVPNFVSQALTGEPLTIYGDGKQTRSFCYVDDMVRGLRAVMDAPREVACGRVYNVGNPDERYIIEFAQLIQKLTGTSAPIAHRPAVSEDPARRCPDITRIRTEIGWEPRVGLDEGLARTIAWFRTVVEPQAVGSEERAAVPQTP
ncbi:MAG TPA: UDP-glucuronic acid decarboxylase family protein [Chloroflexia bacterium]|nr:UDP-glucuronic acid decarboxylase family protein [Chloroflexia bacterium]